jgi:hypothetical protein
MTHTEYVARTQAADQASMQSLEAMIDKYGIDCVIRSVADICGAKAEHIATNWQDASLAKRWAAVEAKLQACVYGALGL